MRILNRGRHRARRGCRDHLRKIALHQAEIEACERIMSKLSDDRDEAMREAGRLRDQISRMRRVSITEPLPAVLVGTAILQSSTGPAPLPPSVLVPVDHPAAGKHRPNWALEDDG